MLVSLAAENPDVLIIAGDHSGSPYGYKGARAIFNIAREHYKGPILACLGNHEYWLRGKKKRRSDDFTSVGIQTWRYHHPTLTDWMRNYDTIVQSAKDNGIHLFEEDGIYRFPDMWGFTFIGHGLWYRLPPNSNDYMYMPIGLEGDTHRYMYKKSTDALMKQLEGLDDKEDGMRIFVSHFPVFDIADNSLAWSGDPFLGSMLHDTYGVRTFINGHSHGQADGPMRWESGSDYYNPRYKIINV